MIFQPEPAAKLVEGHDVSRLIDVHLRIDSAVHEQQRQRRNGDENETCKEPFPQISPSGQLPEVRLQSTRMLGTIM